MVSQIALLVQSQRMVDMFAWAQASKPIKGKNGTDHDPDRWLILLSAKVSVKQKAYAVSAKIDE